MSGSRDLPTILQVYYPTHNWCQKWNVNYKESTYKCQTLQSELCFILCAKIAGFYLHKWSSQQCRSRDMKQLRAARVWGHATAQSCTWAAICIWGLSPMAMSIWAQGPQILWQALPPNVWYLISVPLGWMELFYGPDLAPGAYVWHPCNTVLFSQHIHLFISKSSFTQLPQLCS